MSVSQLIASHFQGASTLYKEAASGKFFLLLTGTEETQSSFDRVCNIVSEYGTLQRSFSGTSGFLTEHCEALIRNTAVQSLGI